MEQENSLIPEEQTHVPEISGNQEAEESVITEEKGITAEEVITEESVTAEQPATEEEKVATEKEVTAEESATTEEEVTTKIQAEPNEIPVIDFSTLSTEEIIRQAQKLLNDYPVTAIRDKMEGLPEVFEKRYKQEYEEALAVFTADGDLPENFEYKNDSRERFNALYKQYRDKKNTVNRQIEAEREENLKIKLGIIEELKALVQKEESMGKTYQEFRELQERWRNTGMVPQAQLNGLLETYHHHIENFFNYIKINKEFRDLDLKRNLDAKLALCEEAEKLAATNDITGAFKQYQLLRDRWREIGPIPREQKEEVWERFKNTGNQITERYHHFFESLRQEQEDNLKVKEELCEKAAAIAQAEYKNYTEWSEASKAILELQEEWRQAGMVPAKDRTKIFKKFRAQCNAFFDRKREAFKKMDGELEKNMAEKIKLCEQAEALQNSTDWRATTDKLVALQKQWKKIGALPQRYSNRLWDRFRKACDVFFNNKKAFYKNIDIEQEKNLELKKALIEEAKQFQLSGNNEEDINKLKEFQTRWAEIGYIPLKVKESIQEEFRSIIDQWFDKLNLDDFDRDLERFRTKLSSLDAGDNKEYRIINERDKLVAKIKMLETEVNTWENNIGFITKSKKSQGLINEMESKIERTKQRLALLQEKLKALDSLI